MDSEVRAILHNTHCEDYVEEYLGMSAGIGTSDDFKKFLTSIFITYALIQMVVKTAVHTDKQHLISKARALKLLANSAGGCMGYDTEGHKIDVGTFGSGLPPVVGKSVVLCFTGRCSGNGFTSHCNAEDDSTLEKDKKRGDKILDCDKRIHHEQGVRRFGDGLAAGPGADVLLRAIK